MEPAVLFGLVSVWAMEEPLLALAPDILPVFVPNVQAKLLATFAVKLMLVVLPLHMVAVLPVVIDGVA